MHHNIFFVGFQVGTDLEPQVASDDSAAELSGLLQDPHFLVREFQFYKKIVSEFEGFVVMQVSLWIDQQPPLLSAYTYASWHIILCHAKYLQPQGNH